MARRCLTLPGSEEFLKDERRMLGKHAYRQEYLCEFLDADSAVFSSEMIEGKQNRS